jgi:signal transduction histidine kinase
METGIHPRTSVDGRRRIYLDRMHPHRAIVNSPPAPSTPRTWSGPCARWPRTCDALLAIAVFLATLFVTEAPDGDLTLRPVGEAPLGALTVFAVASGALYWRRRQPLAALAVVLLAMAVSTALGYEDLSGIAIILLYSLARYLGSDRLALLGIGAVTVFVVVAGLVGGLPAAGIWLSVSVALLAWSAGRWVRLRGLHTAASEREHAAEIRRAAAEERARIARELHDVVAHQVSLMTVQAGAAKIVLDRDPDRARTAMQDVEDVGRQALAELRHLLDVLRPDGDVDRLGPQPGLTDLPGLVQRMAEAGLTVSLTMDGAPARLPTQVGLSAFRIVQEALTNVLRHAGPGTPTEVRISAVTDRGGGDRVNIEILDQGPRITTVPAGGHGIAGMRERATLLGGHLDAAPHPHGGFQVVASLPMDASG